MKKLYLFVALFISAQFLFGQSFNCGDTLVDTRDGKTYATVLIGSQCWMKENLNYGRFVASTSSAVQHSDVANNDYVEKYCQNNDSVYCDTLGGLYDWDEMMDYATAENSPGICPVGWHIPSDGEFTTMVNFAGGNGNALKMLGVGMFPNGIGTNTSGFSAIGAGDRDGLGIFYGIDLRFIFWTSTQFSPNTAWQYTLFAENDSIAHLNDAGKVSGFSVRCIKDLGSSGLNDHFESDQWIAFPNPASEKITLQSLDNHLHSGLKVKLISLTGNYVFEQTFLQTPVELNIAEIHKGIYFIHTEISGKNRVQKLIIQ